MSKPGKSPFCNSCEKCAVNNGKPVHGDGPVPAKVMFVGEAPTSSAQRVGIPFPPQLGTAGATLQSWLHYLNLKREEVYITNVVKCPRIGHVEGSSFENQVRVCVQWLDHEIREVAPKLIIALGGIAQKRFSSRELQGWQYSTFSDVWDRYPGAGQRKVHNGIIYFSCLHPSWAGVTLGKQPAKDKLILGYLDELHQILDTL